MPTGLARDYSRVVLIVVLGAVFAIAAVLLVPGSSSAEDSPPLSTLLQKLKAGGIDAALADGEPTTVSMDRAIAVVLTRQGGTPVVQDVGLFRVTQGELHIDRLAWVVSYDPSTAVAILPSGPMGCHNTLDGDASLIVDVIDAETGEWMFGAQQAGFKAVPGPDGKIAKGCEVD